MEVKIPRYYIFDNFLFDTSKLQLSLNNEVLLLPNKSNEMLFILLQHHGKVVDKEQLINSLWQGVTVDEANITQTVYLLRKALATSNEKKIYIETHKKRGYCFIAEVKEIDIEEDVNLSEKKLPSDLTSNKSTLFSNIFIQFKKPFLYLALTLFIITIGVILFLSFWRPAKQTYSNNQKVRTIAVLPFTTIGASNDDLLGIGMTDSLITKLSYQKQLIIRPTSTILKYRGKQIDIVAVGKELNVDAVLDGTIQQDGERVRLSLRLISINDGQTMWAGVYDEFFSNIFSVQDAIAQKVANTWNLDLDNEKNDKLAKRFTNNIEAYQAYVWGMFSWHKRTREELEKSITFFKEAINKDPNYALAYALLADSYAVIGTYLSDSQERNDMFKKAKDNVQKAIELDEALPEAHSALFVIKHFFDFDKDGAEREIKRAIELNPNNATAHTRYAFFFRDHAMLSQAEIEHRKALEVDPVSMMSNVGLCEVLYFQGKYEEGLTLCQIASSIVPDYRPVKIYTGLIYIEMAKYNEAIKLLNTLKDGSPTLCCYVYTGYIYAKTGYLDKTRKELENLKALKINMPFKYMQIAMLYSLIGDNNSAFRFLNAESKLSFSLLPAVKFDPRFAKLRDDPRFDEFLKEHFKE